MTEIKDIKRYVFDRLKSLNFPVFDTQVPAGAKPPFIRYYTIALSFLTPFKSVHTFSFGGIGVDVVSGASVSTEAETIFQGVQNLLEGLSFETDKFYYRLQLSSVRKTYDDEANLWYITGEFLVHARKKS